MYICLISKISLLLFYLSLWSLICLNDLNFRATVLWGLSSHTLIYSAKRNQNLWFFVVVSFRACAKLECSAGVSQKAHGWVVVLLGWSGLRLRIRGQRWEGSTWRTESPPVCRASSSRGFPVLRPGYHLGATVSWGPSLQLWLALPGTYRTLDTSEPESRETFLKKTTEDFKKSR